MGNYMTSEEQEPCNRQLTEHTMQQKVEPVEQTEWEFSISITNFFIKIRNNVGSMKQEQAIMKKNHIAISNMKIICNC